MKKIFIILAIALVFLFIFVITMKKETKVIVTGTGNPGKIFIYTFDKSSYKRSEIDTGYNLVWTVRVGDIYNNGKNVIVAGIGNGFFGTPYGCQVVAYEQTSNGWKKDVIDSNVDLRCKDLAIGDADNDGKNELVMGTHGEGIINMYKWTGNWNKQEVERNFIKQIDEKEKTNHRVPFEKLTYNTIVQTAVHIVKIVDVDNDGKNEIVATESSPLEYAEGPQISFVNIYKLNDKWYSYTIHEGKGFQHRSILVDDVNYDDKNEVLIGAAPNRLFMLKNDGNWTSDLVYNETADKNMKGLDFQDVYSKGKKVVVLATGIPNTLIYTLEWDGKKFQRTLVGNISQVLEKSNVIENLNYNALEVQAKDVDNDGKIEIIVAGEADTSTALDKLRPQNNVFGWEATPYGFLVVYKLEGSLWKPRVLDTYSVLGMDIERIG